MDAMTFLKERVALFAGVSDELLAPLAQASHITTFKKGQTVLFKGATVDGLHVVCTGKVSVNVKVPNKGVLAVAALGSGEVFGETSILEMGTAGAMIKAEEEGTVVLVIPQDAFRGLLTGDPGFVARMQALVAARKAPPPALPPPAA